MILEMKGYEKIVLDTLTGEQLIDGDSLIEAFKQYLRDELYFEEFEVVLVAEDMKNPYETPYILQEYKGDCEIAEILYSVRSCTTNISVCGLFHLADVKPFEFYMLFA